MGLGLEVDGAAAVNGYIQQGSHVALYATFNQGTYVTRQSLGVLLEGLTDREAPERREQLEPQPDPDADRLHVLTGAFREGPCRTNPPADTNTGKPTSGASDFVLDLAPSDATNVVFAVDHATLYMGLLPPQNPNGYRQPGTIGAPYARVIGVSKG